MCGQGLSLASSTAFYAETTNSLGFSYLRAALAVQQSGRFGLYIGSYDCVNSCSETDYRLVGPLPIGYFHDVDYFQIVITCK